MTTLGTNITFNVIDMQGKNHFPKGALGLVYRHDAIIRNHTTGKTWQETYLIRSTSEAAPATPWRLDKVSMVAGGPMEAIYAEDRTSHWASPEEAAKVLAASLVGFNIFQ